MSTYDPSGYPPPMSAGADGGQAMYPYSAQSPYPYAATGAQPGYPQPGWAPQPDYPSPDYPQPGYPQPGYPQPGAYYDQAPVAQWGYSAGVVPGQTPYQQPGAYYDQKSKLAAGLLGIFLGSLGVHNFYLGHTSKAVGQLVGTIVGYVLLIVVIGIFIIAGISIWALIEGILILSARPGSYPWGVDARGIPLSS